MALYSEEGGGGDGDTLRHKFFAHLTLAEYTEEEGHLSVEGLTSKL